jgi:hypothetical protein
MSLHRKAEDYSIFSVEFLLCSLLISTPNLHRTHNSKATLPSMQSALLASVAGQDTLQENYKTGKMYHACRPEELFLSNF